MKKKSWRRGEHGVLEEDGDGIARCVNGLNAINQFKVVDSVSESDLKREICARRRAGENLWKEPHALVRGPRRSEAAGSLSTRAGNTPSPRRAASHSPHGSDERVNDWPSGERRIPSRRLLARRWDTDLSVSGKSEATERRPRSHTASGCATSRS